MPIIKYRHFCHLARRGFRRTRRGGTRALPSSSRGWLGPPCRAGPPRQKWLPAHSMLGSASRRGLGSDSSVDNKKRMTGSSFSPTPPRPSPVGEGGTGTTLDKTRHACYAFHTGTGSAFAHELFQGAARGLGFFFYALSPILAPWFLAVKTSARAYSMVTASSSWFRSSCTFRRLLVF